MFTTMVISSLPNATTTPSRLLRRLAIFGLAAMLVLVPASAQAAAPEISGMAPTTLNVAGGQAITVQGANLTNITHVASNFNHSLALTQTGQVYAWGDNSQGQLGNGGGGDSSVPVLVDTSGVMAGKTIIGIATGAFHSLAFADDGTVYAWGDNVFGQLGDWSGVDSAVPVAVDLTGDIVQVTASAWTSYALLSDGTMYSWGRGDIGQLGNNTSADSLNPVPVTQSGTLAGKQVVQIAGATGDDFVSVLTNDGMVHSWGANNAGQRGTGVFGGVQAVPSAAAGGAIAGRQIVQIATGAYHVVAVDDEGLVYAWGDNERGQLGIGSSTDSSSPVAVTTDGAVDSGKQTTTVMASAFASYAITQDDMLYSWGYNLNGQLGWDSTPFVEIQTPGNASVSGLRQLAGGLTHMLAINNVGEVLAWGGNSEGQVGDGGTTDQQLPITVGGLLTPLYAAPTVLVGGVAATNVTVLSDGQITFTAPPHVAGTYDVVFTFADGRSVTSAGALTYVEEGGAVAGPGADVPLPPSAGLARARAAWMFLALAFIGAGTTLWAAARSLRRA